jgi:hypothetical protein
LQLLLFPFIPLLLSNIFVILGTCLDFAAEARRLLSEIWLWRRHQRGSTVCGLILDAIVLLCYFKIVLSILERQLMVVEDL